MCILCVLQEASGKARAMLPWLVIFLSVLWAISQLLPRPFRIDMTMARVTCFFFLLAVVLWQRILRPQLLLWQTRRAARLRERRWNEAVELQKLRKIAIRRCRNCLNPYRDQNPGAGKFMCGYCGHVSKRPVLDIPGVRSESNSWNCTHDWSPEVRYWNGAGGGNEMCIPGKSYSGAVVVTRRLVYGVFLTVRWVFRKVFGVGSSSSREGDESSDGESKGLSKKGGGRESKVDKLKRKAEEKRQARLEKEMLEEEERKQREDVARLVEERRKLRDEKLVGETEETKENSKRSEKVVVVVKKESEKKRKERRREKDKCSSKSNSDGEDLEKKYVNMSNNRENDRKKDFDKKSDSEKREFQKACIENIRNQMLEGTVGMKTTSYNKSRFHFDRMTGSFLSSSRGFSGSNFFGKGSSTSPAVAVNKSNKYTTSHAVDRRETCASSTYISNGDDKISSQQQLDGSILPPPTNVWKKSWQQLFTCSSSSSSSSSVYSSGSANFMCNNNTQLNDHRASSSFPPLNHVNFGKSSQTNNSHGSEKKSLFGVGSSLHPLPGGGDKMHDSISEETEHFEDPCYVPDPISLLGPVSESLDNFPVDLGGGFVTDAKIDNPPVHRSAVSTASDSKPSPIESPLSRLRFSREKPSPIGQVGGSPKARDSQTLQCEVSNHSNEQGGTWQMWGNPLGGLDPLGIVGGSVNRLLPIGPSKSNQDNNHAYPGSNNYGGKYQKDGVFTPLGSNGFNEDISWLKKKGVGDTGEENPVLKDAPNRSVGGHSFEQFPSDCWSKSDWVGISSSEDVGNADTSSRTNHGGLFSSDPDIQSVWSFK